MKTKKTALFMLLGAMLLGCFTANAQQETKKWQLTEGFAVHFDFIQANKGWKPAMGLRPGGFGMGFDFNIGAKYDRLYTLIDADFGFAPSFSSKYDQCAVMTALFGVKIGYNLYKPQNPSDDFQMTLLSGLLYGTNYMDYDFEGDVNQTTLAGARNYSARFQQGSLYVPVELRIGGGKAFISLSYLLPVWHGDVYTGTNNKTKVSDAPNMNPLPLRLNFGVMF